MFQYVLISNISQLLLDFEALQNVPNKLYELNSNIKEICRLDPMNCGNDEAEARKVFDMLRFWIYNISQYEYP